MKIKNSIQLSALSLCAVMLGLVYQSAQANTYKEDLPSVSVKIDNSTNFHVKVGIGWSDQWKGHTTADACLMLKAQSMDAKFWTYKATPPKTGSFRFNVGNADCTGTTKGLTVTKFSCDNKNLPNYLKLTTSIVTTKNHNDTAKVVIKKGSGPMPKVAMCP